MFKVLLIFYSSLVFANQAVLEPAYADIRRIDEVVNLTEPEQRNEIEYIVDGVYETNIIRKVNLNVLTYSFDAFSDFSNPSSYSRAGLFPIYNSYVTARRYFDKHDDYKEAKFKVPRDAKDLDSWKSGDFVYFNALGGIALNLNVGVGLAGIGTKVFVEGGFAVYVEKKTDTDVFVEIRKVFTHNYSLLAGTWGVYAEAARLNEATNGINFDIDISSDNGKKVYEDLLQIGRADFLQQDSSGVVRTGKVNSKKALTIRKAAISTPFIPVVDLASESYFQIYSEDRDNIWRQQSRLVTFTNVAKRSHRFFKKKGETSHEFIVDSEESEVLSAYLNVYRKRNHYKTSMLKRALRYLYRKTKIEYFKELDYVSPNEKFGYANVFAKLELGQTLKDNFLSLMKADSVKEATKNAKTYVKSSNFHKLHEIVKRCGGRLIAGVEGHYLTRNVIQENYSKTDACEY